MSTILFATGLKTVIFLSTIFFLVFAYTCHMWMNRKPPELRNVAGAGMVSLLYTFKIVVLSVFILGILEIILTKFI